MKQFNLLLLSGGGGAEHEISLLSADFFASSLAKLPQFNVLNLVLDKNGQYETPTGEYCEITNNREVRFSDLDKAPLAIDYVIPCMHGYPGETGDIQSYFELIKLPYFGCQPEANRNCFNKVTAKMWFSALGIPNTDYLFLHQLDQVALQQAKNALQQWGSLFIKAASQGSSVGCYKVDDQAQLEDSLQQAFGFSEYVLIEKTIDAREIEVAVYEYDGQVIATLPGEILCETDNFYTYDEKYAANSHARTLVVAQNIDAELAAKIQHYAIKAFNGMKLRHLSRIDFFLTRDNEILLNEINTFPGLTPISMFPKMLQNHGHDFSKFLAQTIDSQLSS
ncbi:MAG: D-alanine--D-alanine ligase [Psychromonas sp.]